VWEVYNSMNYEAESKKAWGTKLGGGKSSQGGSCHPGGSERRSEERGLGVETKFRTPGERQLGSTIE